MEQHFFAVVFDVPFEVLHLSVEALSFNVFHDHGRELSWFDDPEDAFSLFVRHDDMVFGEREFVPPTWIAVLGVKKLKSADLS